MRKTFHKIRSYLRQGNRLLVFTLSSLLLFSLGTYAFAAGLATPYLSSDNIVDPTCAPGESNCYVSQYPSDSGAGGKFLRTDGLGNVSWATASAPAVTVVATNADWPTTAPVVGVIEMHPDGVDVNADLPASPTVGDYYTIKNKSLAGGHVVNVNPGVAHIDTAVGVSIADSNSQTFTWNGTEWSVTADAGSTLARILNSSPSNGSLAITGHNFLAFTGTGAQTGISNIHGDPILGDDANDNILLTGYNSTTHAAVGTLGFTSSGLLSLNGLAFPSSTGTAGQVLSTDGSTNLSFVSVPGLVSGSVWANRSTAPGARAWSSVVYGNGEFVAIASDVGGATLSSDVMTSVDGINWTARSIPTAGAWKSLAYGNGLFVAVASSGSAGSMTLTSSDGISWSAFPEIESNPWQAITYGNGMFVAVASSGTHQVMMSTDGKVWVAESASSAKSWDSIAYGNGIFVATASDTTTTSIMRSLNASSWADETTPISDGWSSVTYGNGYFVATSTTAILTSSDASVWSAFGAASSNSWNSIAYGNGTFVAVGSGGTAATQIQTSTDPISSGGWSNRTAPSARQWQSVAYGNGMFVAVANDGTTATDIMTSGAADRTTVPNNNIYQGGITVNGFSAVFNSATIQFPNITPTVACNSNTAALGYDASGALLCNTGVSDERLKNDITPLDTATGLAAIQKLNPVSYYWKDTSLPGTGTTQQQFGFIAQDVQRVLPNLVTVNPPTYLTPDVTYGLNYQGFAAITIQAVKELDLKVEPLTSIDPNVNGSLASLILQFLQNAVVTIKGATIGTLNVGDQVCADDVCVTKAQFKNLLLQAGGTSSTPAAASPATPPTDPSTTPPADPPTTPAPASSTDTTASPPVDVSTPPADTAGGAPAPDPSSSGTGN